MTARPYVKVRHVLLRRIGAFLVDCAGIMCYAGALLIVTLLLARPELGGGERTAADALRLQAVGFITLTAPVALIFSWMEAGRLQATPGKLLLWLRVSRLDGSRLTFARSLARNAMKFLPWEIAHAGVHHAAVPGHPYPWLGTGFSIAGMALAGVYLVSCIVCRRRTIYDQIAEARVG